MANIIPPEPQTSNHAVLGDQAYRTALQALRSNLDIVVNDPRVKRIKRSLQSQLADIQQKQEFLKPAFRVENFSISQVELPFPSTFLDALDSIRRYAKELSGLVVTETNHEVYDRNDAGAESKVWLMGRRVQKEQERLIDYIVPKRFNRPNLALRVGELDGNAAIVQYLTCSVLQTMATRNPGSATQEEATHAAGLSSPPISLPPKNQERNGEERSSAQLLPSAFSVDALLPIHIPPRMGLQSRRTWPLVENPADNDLPVASFRMPLTAEPETMSVTGVEIRRLAKPSRNAQAPAAPPNSIDSSEVSGKGSYVAPNQDQVESILQSWELPQYGKRHDWYHATHVPGTFEWVFRSQEFKDWIHANSHKGLVCRGSDGSGKSTLTAFLASKLPLRSAEPPLVASYHVSRLQKGECLQMCQFLVKQLCEKLLFVPPTLLRRDSHALREGFSMGTMIRALHQIFEHTKIVNKKIIFIIDGVDELGEDCVDDAKRFVRALQGSEAALFVTTSFRAVSLFNGYPCLDLKGADHERDIQCFVETGLQNRLPHYSFSEENMVEIAKRISKGSQDSFLRAALYLDAYLKHAKITTPENALKIMDVDAHTRFPFVARSGLGLIEQHPTSLRHLATLSLSWVKEAVCTLQIRALAEALLVGPTDLSHSNYLDEPNPSTPSFSGRSVSPGARYLANSHTRLPTISQLILETCQGILWEDPATSTIGFRHGEIEAIVPDWLAQQHRKGMLPIPELGEIIISYLSHGDFEIPLRANEAEIRSLLEAYPFLGYAAKYWIIHARRMKDTRQQELILKFLKKPLNLALTIQLMHHRRNLQLGVVDAVIRTQVQTPLQIAAHLGLENAVQVLLNESRNHLEQQHDQALCLAAEAGHASVVTILLDSGVSPKAEWLGKSALEHAMKVGREEAYQCLIRRYCLQCVEQQIPVKDMFLVSTEPAVAYVSAYRRSLHLKPSDFYTPSALMYAVYRGDITTVAMLLTGLAFTGRQLSDDKGATEQLWLAFRLALLWSCKETDPLKRKIREDMVQLLVLNGADVNFVTHKHETALQLAIRNSPDVKPIKLLLSHGAAVDQKLDNGRTALFEAVRLGNVEQVRTLLSHGANIKTLAHEGQSVLDEANSHPSPEVMSELVLRFVRYKDYLTWFPRKNPVSSQGNAGGDQLGKSIEGSEDGALSSPGPTDSLEGKQGSYFWSFVTQSRSLSRLIPNQV